MRSSIPFSQEAKAICTMVRGLGLRKVGGGDRGSGGRRDAGLAPVPLGSGTPRGLDGSPGALCPSTLGGSIPLFQTQQWSTRWGAAVDAESLRHQGKFWHMVSVGWRGLAKGRHPSGCGVISSPVSYRLHTSGRTEPMSDDIALVVSCQRCINLVDHVLSELLWKASQSTHEDVAAMLSVEAPLSPANTLTSYSSHGRQTQNQAELWDE